eukprot:gene42637-56672_t
MRDALDLDATLEDFISPGSEWVEINGQKKHVKSYLTDFLFSPQRATSPVRTLSGGERNRLLLARLFARPANVLVLDEPTNDLDIDTLELLEDLLQQYEGTVFLVSHDRRFLDNVVTSTLVFEGDGRWREYVGDVQDWLTQSARSDALQRERDALLGIDLEHLTAQAALPQQRAVEVEVVDADDSWNTELAHVLDMSTEIDQPLAQRVEVLLAELILRHAAMHLQRAHRGNDHDSGRREARLAALDVEELLRTQIRAEAGLGHHVVSELQARARGDDRVAAMGDVGEGAAMDEGGIAFERLHEVRLQRVLEKNRHRRRRLDVGGRDGLLVARIADDHLPEARLEVGEVLGKAEYRHDFRGDGDVEAGLARIAVGDPAKACVDLAQGPVVHVHDTPPHNAARVDAQRIAPVDVVVDQRREQVMRRGDGVKIARE